MNFGEKLRHLRQSRNLTQPELVNAISSEQSYPPKLENGKSVPSADVLSRILAESGLGVDELVDELDRGSRSQLRRIAEVANYFNRRKELVLGNRRR